jgi:PAS domain-containing protein
MVMATLDGRIVAANRAFERQLDLSPCDATEKGLGELITQSSEELAHYLRLCARSRSLVLGALTLQLPEGKTLSCRAEGTLLMLMDFGNHSPGD